MAADFRANPNWQRIAAGAAAAAGGRRPPLPRGAVAAGAATTPAVDYGSLWGGGKQKQPSTFGAIGQGLMRGLRVIDKPRAGIVSTLKELQDLSQGEGFSVKDLREQFNRNIGFQEVLDDAGVSGGWQRSALGFVGDVALDPLTYVTFGTAAAAKAGAGGVARTVVQKELDDALQVAVRSGSSKLISEGIAKSAAEAGLTGDAAVQRLIVSAAERGRGALTAKQLARDGVTPDLVEALALPTRMRKTIGVGQRARVELPGTGQFAQVGEAAKGEVKRAFRLKPGAAKLRDKFIPEFAGERQLTQDVYNQLLPMGERAARVLAKTTVNASKATARGWAADTAHRTTAALAKDWFNLSDDAARVATNSIETGGQGALEQAWRVEAKRIRDELEAAGVQLGDLGDDYVPHQQTADFVDLLRKNAEARDWAVKNLRTQEGFQKVRALRAGDSFFDELFNDMPLQFGTIEEINGRSLAKFGVKMFKDDLREIVPGYIRQAGEALQRAAQITELEKLGLTRALSQDVVQKANTDPKFLRQVARTEKRLARQRQAEQINLKTAGQIRRDNLPKAAQALRNRRKAIAAQATKLQNELNSLQRRLRARQDVVDRLTAEVDVLRASRDALEASARQQRGAIKSQTARKIKAIDAQIAPKQAELAKVQATIEDIGTGRWSNLLKDQLVNEDALRAQINALTEEGRLLADDYALLAEEATPIGAGATLAEQQLRASNRQWELLLKKQARAVDSWDAAAGAVRLAQAPNEWAIDQLKRVMLELDKGIAAGTNAGGAQVRAGAKQARLMDLRQRYDTVMEVLRRSSDPSTDVETQMFARLEAAAAASDAAAAKAGKDVQLLEQMLKALENKKFISEVVESVDDGMVAIGRNLQMPEWLDQALTLKRIADEGPEISKYLRKYYNLFKGYAILRPGFHVRNLYSAMFNMYLEAGPQSIKSANEFFKFFSIVEKNPGDYMRVAEQTFGAQKAARLQEAWYAAAGSGSGQIAGEMTSGAIRAGSKNPLSEEFVALRKSREVGEKIENRVRGAHAYDVLQRGGTVDQALATVNKWQFNYTDLTSFDQTMKLINPFWVFFSRNLALQAQEWGRTLGRYNRTVENFRRNVGYGLPEDENKPAWFEEAGAIPIGMGSEGVRYWFPDLPAGVFPGEIDKLTTPSELPRLIGETGPWISVPYELASGTQAFSGIPIPDRYEAAPAPLRFIPGIEALPFIERGAEGPMMTAAARSALSSIIPGIGQVERLFPAGGTPGAERQASSIAAYLTGIGVRENTERSQRGEQYRRMLEEQERERLRESLGL